MRAEVEAATEAAVLFAGEEYVGGVLTNHEDVLRLPMGAWLERRIADRLLGGRRGTREFIHVYKED